MRVWPIGLYALVIVGIVSCGGQFPTKETVGDGELAALGPLSYYPRYTIEFEAIEVLASADRSYHLKHFPTTEYTLHLQILVSGTPVSSHEDWRSVWKVFEDSSARALVRIKEEGGTVLALVDQPLVNGWYPTVWGNDHFVTDRGLADLKLDGDKNFVVDVVVEARHVLSKDISVKPVLIGGGFRKD